MKRRQARTPVKRLPSAHKRQRAHHKRAAIAAAAAAMTQAAPGWAEGPAEPVRGAVRWHIGEGRRRRRHVPAARRGGRGGRPQRGARLVQRQAPYRRGLFQQQLARARRQVRPAMGGPSHNFKYHTLQW